jgi:hypothetical protein
MPGDFWALPLRTGAFACARVIQLKEIGDGRSDSRSFLAGLIDWIGQMEPDSAAIAGRGTVVQGQAHILAIRRAGGSILGHRSLSEDKIEPAAMLSHAGGPNVMLLRGFNVLRLATAAEREALPIFRTFGYSALARHAEALLL